MKIIYLIFIATLLFGQGRPTTNDLFVTGQDTILDTGGPDTVQFRLWIAGQVSPYYTLDNTVTSLEKVAETSQVHDLSGNSNWIWAEHVQLKIFNALVGDTIESKLFTIGAKAGAVTAILVPDSVNADTLFYTSSVIGGN